MLEDAKSGATFTQGAAILQYLGRVADPPLAPADAALDAQCCELQAASSRSSIHPLLTHAAARRQCRTR